VGPRASVDILKNRKYSFAPAEPWIVQRKAELLVELRGCSFCIARDVYNLNGLESSYGF